MIHTIDNPKAVHYFFDPEEINFTGVVKDEDGDIVYYVSGKFHRVGGPAIIHANGSKAYYLNGNIHREDGPTRIGADGTTEYWLNDKQLDICTNQELKDYLIS